MPQPLASSVLPLLTRCHKYSTSFPTFLQLFSRSSDLFLDPCLAKPINKTKPKARQKQKDPPEEKEEREMIFWISYKGKQKEMALDQSFFNLIIFFLVAGFASSSTHISNGALESHGITGRNLLQAKGSCDEDFEHKNYTIITSQCKGPQYPAKSCCNALKEFACPFAEKLNDLSSDCASTMFTYINLYGKYPPGLFANMCHDVKQGLECPAPTTTTTSDTAVVKPTLISGFLLLLFHLFSRI